jgi:hypothetical protein
MAGDSSGFFSDPKNAISLFALLTSIVSLVWTLASQWEQNRRWDLAPWPLKERKCGMKTRFQVGHPLGTTDGLSVRTRHSLGLPIRNL